MRILFLNHNVVGSGTFFRAFHFGKELTKSGHEVTLVTTSKSSRLKPHTYDSEGVCLIEAPDMLVGRARTGWCPYNTLVRRSLVQRTAFDVVHAFDSRPVVIYPALAAAARANALFVMDWADWWGRGGWINERSGPVFRALLGGVETWFEESFRLRAHGHTVISQALAQRSQALGMATARIARIPQGCEPRNGVRISRSEARRRLGMTANARLLVHVGVLTPGDYTFMRDAFRTVREQFADAELAIVGRTGMRVPDRAGAGIRVTGALDAERLADWVAAANAGVIPCRDTVGNRARWPSKLADYLASERAVVMPRVGDAAEFVERSSSGWTTSPTVAALAAGMQQALANSEAADAAGRRGAAAAREELAWPRLTQQLLAFYEKLDALR